MSHDNDFPFLTIIICTLNSAAYIEDNLNSIVNQNYSNFEIIFVDGGSEDDTISIITRIVEKTGIDYRIIYDQGGLSQSMNRGVLESRGEYVTFLNSDDFYFSNNSIRNSLECIRDSDFDIVYGQCLILKSEKVTKKYPKKGHSAGLLKFMNFIPHPTAFIRKSLFSDYGLYDSKYKYNFDYEFWIRISKISELKFHYLPVPISYFRVHPKSISYTNRKTIIKSNLDMRRHFYKSRFFVLLFFMLFIRDFIWIKYSICVNLVKKSFQL